MSGEIVGARHVSDKQALILWEELQRISGSKDLDGLDYRKIVETAKRNKKSPLHPHFTWDVKKAAWRCWIDEARKLVSMVRLRIVTVDGYEGQVRAAVSYRYDDKQDKKTTYHGLMSREKMKKFKPARDQYVAGAYDELRSWYHRYSDIEELSRIRALIGETLNIKQKKKAA